MPQRQPLGEAQRRATREGPCDVCGGRSEAPSLAALGACCRCTPPIIRRVPLPWARGAARPWRRLGAAASSLRPAFALSPPAAAPADAIVPRCDRARRRPSPWRRASHATAAVSSLMLRLRRDSAGSARAGSLRGPRGAPCRLLSRSKQSAAGCTSTCRRVQRVRPSAGLLQHVAIVGQACMAGPNKGEQRRVPVSAWSDVHDKGSPASAQRGVMASLASFVLLSCCGAKRARETRAASGGTPLVYAL